jgi:hypothetical protein
MKKSIGYMKGTNEIVKTTGKVAVGLIGLSIIGGLLKK